MSTTKFHLFKKMNELAPTVKTKEESIPIQKNKTINSLLKCDAESNSNRCQTVTFSVFFFCIIKKKSILDHFILH